MQIRDLIVDSCVCLDLAPTTRDEAIADLIACLVNANRVREPSRCLADVLKRERQRTTGIGGGLAIPHACTGAVLQPVLAIGRNPAGIDFGALDNEPVKLVFLLLSPQNCHSVHLRILARLAEILKSEGATTTLLEAQSAADILAFFEQRGQELGEMEAPAEWPKVCVAGAGAGGLGFAAHLALLGCRVHLFNRSPARIKPVRQMEGIQASGEVTGFARIPVATTDPGEAVAGADLILVVLPAVGHRETALRLGPVLKDGQIVILNPGRTGGALEFTAVLRQQGFAARPIIAEAQTLLYACREVNPGSVHFFGIKNAVPVAALPAYLTPDVLAVTSRVLPQFVAGDNVLKTSLDNIGSIFHPALTILNAAWIEERHGEFEYYHEGASPSVALILEAMDRERVAVAAALGIGAVSARDWLYLAYRASGKDLHEAMQANLGYQGIKAPNRLTHRYITEDVPMSLVPIAALGEHLNVPVPTIKAFIHLASLLHRRDYWAEGRTLDKLGLAGLTVKQIRRLVVEGLT